MGGKRLNTEQFVAKAIDKHGDRYDYSKAVWAGSTGKVEIVCKQHGSFWQQAYSHYTIGQNCPSCVGNAVLTLDEFISRSSKVHGDLYDYSKVVISGVESKVEIGCKNHGYFWQTPMAHYKLKQGCPQCYRDRQGLSQVLTTEEFVSKAESLNGLKYDYSLVEYVRSSKPVSIICNSCSNEFKQTPNAHLAGKGCRHCNLSGFTFSKPSYLYVLECEDIVKVGITNKHPLVRARDVTRSSGKEFSVVKSYFLDHGSEAMEIEGQLLEMLRQQHNGPEDKFNGYTECFIGVDKIQLLSIIEEKITGKKHQR